MFKIEDGRESFYQWDLDRRLIVLDTIEEVHFCNRTGDCSLVCETFVEDGITLVNVPNIILQNDFKIKVYGYDDNHTKYEKCFEVLPRSKPADYAYTETEILNWSKINEKVEEALNEVGAATEAANKATADAIEAAQLCQSTAEDVSSTLAEMGGIIQDAQVAVDNANNAAEYAQETIAELNSTFSNVLKGSVSDSFVSLGDVSPVPHTVKCTTDNASVTSVTVKGANLFNVFSANCVSSNNTCKVEALEAGCVKTTILKKGSPQYGTASIDIPISKAGTLYFKVKAICSSTELTKPELHIRLRNSAGGAYVTKKTFTNITPEWNELTYTLSITSSDLEKYDGIMLLVYVKNNSVDMYNVGEYVELKEIMLSTINTEYVPYTGNTCEVVDGTAEIESIHPMMNISSDVPDAILKVEYNRDINKAFAELQQAIISLGGNI